MCQQGIPFGPDASQACDLYTKAADQGHVGAIFNLACLYRDGQCDVEQDLVRAKELFEAAAAKGHAAALCGLAGLHDAEGDHIGSFKLYKRAATSGYSTALHNVACALRSGEGVERNMEMVSEGTMVRCSSISDCACCFAISTRHPDADPLPTTIHNRPSSISRQLRPGGTARRNIMLVV